MGGEGFTGHAIQSLKYNRGLVKRHSYFEMKKGELGQTSNKELQFRKLNKAELLEIREKAEQFERKWKRKMYISITISVILFAIGVFLLDAYLR